MIINSHQSSKKKKKKNISKVCDLGLGKFGESSRRKREEKEVEEEGGVWCILEA